MSAENLPASAKTNGDTDPTITGQTVASGDFISRGPIPNESADIRTEVSNLRGTVNRAYHRIGQLLYEVQSRQLFAEWGFGSFGEYVEKELGWGRRKGEYLASIYKKLVLGAKVDVADLEGIEWTKARALASVATEENVHDWIDKARESTTDQLNNEVRIERRRLQSGDSESDSEGDGDTNPPEPITRLNVSLYESQYHNVMAALAIAEKVTGSDARNHQLDVVCLEYQAFHSEGQPQERLQWMMNQLEKSFPVRMFAISSSLPAEDYARIDAVLQDIVRKNQNEASD